MAGARVLCRILAEREGGVWIPEINVTPRPEAPAQIPQDRDSKEQAA